MVFLLLKQFLALQILQYSAETSFQCMFSFTIVCMYLFSQVYLRYTLGWSKLVHFKLI